MKPRRPRVVSNVSRSVKNTTEVRKGRCAKKIQDQPSMKVPQEKDDICNRRQITPQRIYLHHGFT